MSNYSDSQWQISIPNLALLRDEFQKAAQNDTKAANMSIELKIGFDRTNPPTAQTSTLKIPQLLNGKFYQVILDFNETLNMPCSKNPNLTKAITIPLDVITTLRFTDQDYPLAINLTSPISGNLFIRHL